MSQMSGHLATLKFQFIDSGFLDFIAIMLTLIIFVGLALNSGVVQLICIAFIMAETAVMRPILNSKRFIWVEVALTAHGFELLEAMWPIMTLTVFLLDFQQLKSKFMIAFLACRLVRQPGAAKFVSHLRNQAPSTITTSTPANPALLTLHEENQRLLQEIQTLDLQEQNFKLRLNSQSARKRLQELEQQLAVELDAVSTKQSV